MANSLLKFSLKTNLVKSIVSEIVSNFSKYYYAYGRSYAWPGGDIVSAVSDSYEYETAVRKDLLFMKQIDANDIAPIIRRIRWVPGYTFDMYDDYNNELALTGVVTIANGSNVLTGIGTVFTEELGIGNIVVIKGLNYRVSVVVSNTEVILATKYNLSLDPDFTLTDQISITRLDTSYSGATTLENAEFYCVTEENNVYKCLFNNNNKPSSVMPTGTDDKVITLSDNYKWKYMYTIPLSLRNKFSTLTTIPVTTALSNQFYSAGSIVSATIENPGKKYAVNSYRVTGFKIIKGGLGYDDPGTSITVAAPDQVGGTQATLSFTIVGGAISTVICTNPLANSGYSYPPTVTVSGGTPTDNAIIEPIVERINTTSYTTLSIVGDGVLEENPYELYANVSGKSPGFIIDKPGSGYASVTLSFKSPDLNGGVIASAVGIIEDLLAGTVNTAAATTYNGNPATTITGTFTRVINVGDSIKIGNTVYGVVSRTLVSGQVLPASIILDAAINPLPSASTEVKLTGCVTGINVTNVGYGYSNQFKSFTQDNTALNVVTFTATSIANRTGTGFEFSINSKKNEAQIVPLINVNGEIVAVRIVKPGIGYTFGVVNIDDSYTEANRPSDFEKASILLNFGIGDIESRQSTVELKAKDGAIHAVRVIDGGAGYDQLPVVSIEGDGSGATAVAVLDNDGKIDRIDIVNEGSGYTRATAVLTGSSPSKAAILSVPISPKGGHGIDAVSELYCKSILFHGILSTEKNKGFIPTNEYRQVCILKNPKIFGKSNSLRSSIASTCFIALGGKGQQSFSNITIDSVLTYTDTSVTPNKSYQFRVIEKNADYSETESALLLSYLDNYIPPDSATYGNTTLQVTFSTVSKILPDVNKFSGELLTIDNRGSFSSSNQQIIVVTNTLTF